MAFTLKESEILITLVGLLTIAPVATLYVSPVGIEQVVLADPVLSASHAIWSKSVKYS